MGALRDELIARGGAAAEALAQGRAVRMALNQTLCEGVAAIRQGDEVAFFPRHRRLSAMAPDKSVDQAISARTRKALSEARARGVQLGRAGADNLRATVEKRKSTADAFARQHEALFAELQARGLTHRAMAAELNTRGIAAARVANGPTGRYNGY